MGCASTTPGPEVAEPSESGIQEVDPQTGYSRIVSGAPDSVSQIRRV